MASKVSTTKAVTVAPATEERAIREILHHALRDELRQAIIEEFRERRSPAANFVSFFWGIVLGLIVGGLAGMLLAPSEGEKTRDRLSVRFGSWFDGMFDGSAPHAASAMDEVTVEAERVSPSAAAETAIDIPVTPRSTP
jgi:hypothetical protein